MRLERKETRKVNWREKVAGGWLELTSLQAEKASKGGVGLKGDPITDKDLAIPILRRLQGKR